MLDLMRLEGCPLLQAAGWNRSRAGHLAERLGRLNLCYPPPVSPEAIFPAAWEIVDALEGTVIPNQCPELGPGATCHAVEFDFLGYDASLRPKLEAIGKAIGRRVLFLGIGYDIAGDWLVDETGMLYFLNRLGEGLFPFSHSIYQFLEKDLYGYTSLDGSSIFSRKIPPQSGVKPLNITDKSEAL